MKKILVPYDFSAVAQHAFRFAMGVAGMSKGEVLVMHAINYPVSVEQSFDMQPFIFDNSLTQQMEEDAKKKFEEARSKYVIGSTIPVRFFIQFGTPAVTIKGFTSEHKIDLVVMGTHGTDSTPGFFVGSNAEKIVRSSQVPVWVIRKFISPATIKNIVLPSSLDLNQSAFIDKVKALQTFLGARLHVLSINTPAHFKRDQDIQSELMDFAKTFKLKNYTLNMRNDLYEQDGIIRFAYELKAGMIAMNTHGRKGLAHWLAGSITEDVVNRVHCPIWTYTTPYKKGKTT